MPGWRRYSFPGRAVRWRPSHRIPPGGIGRPRFRPAGRAARPKAYPETPAGLFAGGSAPCTPFGGYGIPPEAPRRKALPPASKCPRGPAEPGGHPSSSPIRRGGPLGGGHPAKSPLGGDRPASFSAGGPGRSAQGVSRSAGRPLCRGLCPLHPRRGAWHAPRNPRRKALPPASKCPRALA